MDERWSGYEAYHRQLGLVLPQPEALPEGEGAHVCRKREFLTSVSFYQILFIMIGRTAFLVAR